MTTPVIVMDEIVIFGFNTTKIDAALAKAYQALAALRWVSDSTSPDFRGSSMMMRSAQRPVNTPPTEVASRTPLLSGHKFVHGVQAQQSKARLLS